MSGQRCTDEFKEGLSPSPRTRHPTNSKREPGPFSIRPTFSTCRLPFASFVPRAHDLLRSGLPPTTHGEVWASRGRCSRFVLQVLGRIEVKWASFT
jgi:hypothetical protein